MKEPRPLPISAERVEEPVDFFAALSLIKSMTNISGPLQISSERYSQSNLLPFAVREHGADWVGCPALTRLD